MKCQVCQADLPAGTTFCTNCGTPVPSNPYGSPSSPSSPNQGIAPTMLASSPPPPSDPYGQSANPYAPPPNPYGTPATDYGAPSNPYTAPPQPLNPYGAPPANPYGTPSSPGYNPPPGGFGAPVAPYGQPPYIPQPPKKKGPNGCVIAAIIVGVILLLGVSGIVALGVIGANAAKSELSTLNATSTADMGTANALLTPTTGSSNGTTPTAGNSGSVPSSSQIDPNAQANITGAQTSSSVDSNYKPTHITSTFTTSDTVYITYTLSGKAGYTMEKTYASDDTLVTKSASPYTINSGDSNGYFSLSGGSSGSYTTGIYWCQQSDCSDAALAQVVTFSVS